MYEWIGPFGNGPGFQEIVILLESTAVARTITGADVGGPAANVLITTLGRETIGSLCGERSRATRNYNQNFFIS